MKRSPLSRKPYVPTPQARERALERQRKPRKALSPESVKGKAQRILWQQERDAQLAAQPACQGPQYGLSGACWTPVGKMDAHHVQNRGAGGRRGPAGPLVTLCRRHHDWVTEHPRESRALGLVVSRAVSSPRSG